MFFYAMSKRLEDQSKRVCAFLPTNQTRPDDRKAKRSRMSCAKRCAKPHVCSFITRLNDSNGTKSLMNETHTNFDSLPFCGVLFIKEIKIHPRSFPTSSTVNTPNDHKTVPNHIICSLSSKLARSNHLPLHVLAFPLSFFSPLSYPCLFRTTTPLPCDLNRMFSFPPPSINRSPTPLFILYLFLSPYLHYPTPPPVQR